MIAVLTALCLTAWPHLPSHDPTSYFHFADSRSFFGIPNTFDVLSNLAFLFFGLLGFKRVTQSKHLHTPFFIFCGFLLAASIVLTCFGSMYFHWNPNPKTLLWDRLPMTLAFSTITALALADRVNERIGRWALFILIPLGLISVIGLKEGWLTLKPYIVVQFGSILFIALIVAFFKERLLLNFLVWSSIGLYAIAKVFELGDRAVFETTGFVSGHSLKHLFAALAVYQLFFVYRGKKS